MFLHKNNPSLATIRGIHTMDIIHSASRLVGITAAAIILSACVADPEPTPESSSSLMEASSSSEVVSSEASSSSVISESSSSVVLSSSSSVTTISSSSMAQSSSSEVLSSSEALSSSEVSSSSSAESSSSTPAGGDFSGTPDLKEGKKLYELQSLGCVTCHGPDGQEVGIAPRKLFPVLASLDTQQAMAQYLHDAMPQGGVTACQDSCARDIAAYILNNFDTGETANPGDHIPVSTDISDARKDTGQKLFQQPIPNCGNGCHKPTDFIDCVNCDTWEGLRDYIATTMPPQQSNSAGGADTLSPDSCIGDCADRTADYIWKEVNNWTLTTLNGQDSGFKEIIVDRFGNDTQRLKTYDMLTTDFARIFGDVPPVLAASRGAFKPEPNYWHTEGEVGAVALNIIVNAAIEGCATEPLPALNESSLRSSCADWANRMWLRDATEAELQSCVDVALVDTAEINNPTMQANFACVSMMTSVPALTF